MDDTARRQQGMALLEKGIAQSEVARRCGVSRQTASKWAERLEAGVSAESVKPGPKPILDDKTFQKFEKLLAKRAKQGTKITLDYANQVLSEELGVEMSRAQLARVLSNSESATPRQRRFKQNTEVEILRNWESAAWKF